MRIHLSVPLLGFAGASAGAWETYRDVPPLVSWWQAAGWLVPDAGWLNEPFSHGELEGLAPRDARELRRWHTLSRGDALFFEW